MGDLDDFLAKIDELTSDSFCSGGSQLGSSAEQQKLQEENRKLKQLLITKKNENNEIVELYRQTAQCVISLQHERDQANEECRELRNQLDAMNKENINLNFSFKQQVSELKENQSQQTKDYSDLCRGYLDVLSEVTCFYNYEIKRVDIRKTITKSEVFLRKIMGSAFEKPKILQTKMGFDTDSVTSKASTEAGKKRSSKAKESPTKRRKTNIWDMKSISQASSPAASVRYIDEGTSDLSSGVFSIGNETSYSLIQNRNKVPEKLCNCEAADSNGTLVSVGTNTDCPDFLPSVPHLLADNFNGEDLDDRNEVVHDISISDHNFSSEETSQPEMTSVNSSVPAKPSATLVPTFVSCSTSTDSELLEAPKKFVDKETSTNCRKSVEKGTSTVQSLVTRGNQTVGMLQSDKGIQMPEVSFKDIFDDTLFELPVVLSPLRDDVELTKSVSTITDLCNVTREIDLVRTPLPTVDVQEPSPRNTIEDETIFSLLGQTLFRLFLKRMQKSSKIVSNEEYAKKKIWRLLRRELNDRYSELTFDELLNNMYVEPEKAGACPTEDELNDYFSIESKYSLKMVSPIKDVDSIQEKEDFEKGLPAEALMVHSGTSTELVAVEPAGLTDLPSVAEEACSETRVQVENSKTSQLSLESHSEESEMETVIEIVETCIPKTPEVRIVSTPDVTILTCNYEENAGTPSVESRLASENLSECENNVPDSELNTQFEEALKQLQSILPSPRTMLSPIEALSDVIWENLFPSKEISDGKVSPLDDEALDGFDIEHDPIEIPLDAKVEQILREPIHEYTECETPKSPPPFAGRGSILEVRIIPTESRKNAKIIEHAQLTFDPEVRKSLLSGQQRQKICSKAEDKLLCRARKAINFYLKSQVWSQESLDECVKAMEPISEPVLLQAIFETLEDNELQDEISYEFTPPAPPLPAYQQKLIVLVQSLSQQKPHLPHKLFEDLECRIFNLESFTNRTCDELRNLSYWATALIDLFLDGDPTIALYFIVKSIYFLGHKSIPMSFAVIKAFPSAIPKKSCLMKKYCKDIDWENMTGLQLSKVSMNVEWMESLELTVVFLLASCFQPSKNKHDDARFMENHELLNFLPRFYGFQLSFISAPKLLDILVQRLEAGRLENLSLSFILLAKRSSFEFTIKSMMKGKLVPLLRSWAPGSAEMTPEMTTRLCLLIEAISSILKAFIDEKEKSFVEVFALIVSILARSKDAKVKDTCMLAILRLQRFIDNQQEVYKIMQDNYQESDTNINDTLSYSIRTFVHRKPENFFSVEL